MNPSPTVPTENIFSLWQNEQKFITAEKTAHPELFVREPQSDGHEILERVGIVLPTKSLVPGYLKFDPFDFIVEEVQVDGRVSTVEYEPAAAPAEPGRAIFADLVKVGISSIEAIKELGRVLGLSEKAIGSAGIKDAVALTSQRISLQGVDPVALSKLAPTNIFLKNLSSGQGAIATGGLKGNRFTILMRTPQEPPMEIETQLSALKASGFWNFYWLQRFGDRLLSHWWGLLLLRGDYASVVKSYLCDVGPRDLPYYQNFRQQIAEKFGDWASLSALLAPMNYSFRHELILIDYLKTHPDDWLGALNLIPEQIKLWCYAYASYLFNRKLSAFAAGTAGSVPDQFPLLLSPNAADREPYKSFLAADKVPANFEQKLRPFRFIRLMPRQVKLKLHPVIHSFQRLAEGLVISFDLDKGAYATTLLGHVFEITSGQPVPEWVKTNYIDLKQTLGTGSLQKTRELFKPYLVKQSGQEVGAE